MSIEQHKYENHKRGYVELDAGWLKNGWLGGVRRCFSPNFDARPADETVDLLVVHNISLPPGLFGTQSVEAFFSNCLDATCHDYFKEIAELRVSSHFYVRRNGELSQFVSTEQRAWHAGVSEYAGRVKCNDFSIGVEMEGCDDVPYTFAQYRVLAQLSVRIMEQYPAITVSRITGHENIAPGRKTDPGPAFDWTFFREMLADFQDVQKVQDT
ncbi:MAG: 1,6-anhydro-N-acetylmuramyl-L-alanine amidase AmpD [Pseudomonadales bacterium]